MRLTEREREREIVLYVRNHTHTHTKQNKTKQNKSKTKHTIDDHNGLWHSFVMYFGMLNWMNPLLLHRRLHNGIINHLVLDHPLFYTNVLYCVVIKSLFLFFRFFITIIRKSRDGLAFSLILCCRASATTCQQIVRSCGVPNGQTLTQGKQRWNEESNRTNAHGARSS